MLYFRSSTLLIIIISIFLSGCVNPRASANREASSLNLAIKKRAAKNAKDVQIGGRIFRVTVIKEGSYSAVRIDPDRKKYEVKKFDKPYASVRLITPSSAPYTGLDLEAAAQQVSGCNAKFRAGVLKFIKGFSGTTTDLSKIERKTSSGFTGWRTDLFCSGEQT